MQALTARVMQHPIAGATFASIQPDADLIALAETHARLITHKDYQSHATALGIEYYVRNLATMHFHREPVNKALRIIERRLDSKTRRASDGRLVKNSTRTNQILSRPTETEGF